jgi:hypothetical protein
MRYTVALLATLLLGACSTKDKYDVARYFKPQEQDAVLTSIVSYVFVAPPYTEMKDRFKDNHRGFYSEAASRFSIVKYYIADDGTHYFYIIRPGPKSTEKRGVGGYFKMDKGDKNYELKEFHEVFVTPVMPEADIKDRCSFLFDEMVHHTIDKFLPMSTYIQWPNQITYYDTITYQWKMRPGKAQ